MTVPLDGQARELLEFLRGLGYPPTRAVDIELARSNYRASRVLLHPVAPAVSLVENLKCSGLGGAISLRHYRAAGLAADAVVPGLVFLHGGGWNTGDLDTHDVLCRQLANVLRGAVVAVDYRLAPEHPFPAAFDDALAALDWMATNCARLRIAADQIVVGGDSAGGNLAAAIALAARDSGGPALAAQLLVYPATDAGMTFPSYQQSGTGYMLEAIQMEWNWAQYCPSADRATNWQVSPHAASSLAGLPPAIVITAGYDPLRDEGLAYADRLHAAGVPVVAECFEGMIHGFLPMGGRLAAANHAIVRIGQGLRQILGLAQPPGARRSS
jgi:acetyl esterase